MTTILTCPICGNTSFTNHLQCTDYTVSHEKFNLVTCSTCQLLITSPRPANQELGKYYQSEDYISHTSKGNSLTNILYLRARRITLQSKRKLVSALKPEKGNLLDVGCGTGDFLQTCQEHGWKVSGVEPNQQARNQCLQKGIKTIPTIDNLTESYHLISMWHVLEHVPDLNETLQKLYTRLEQQGIILIAVPNHSSYDGQRYQQFWAGYDVPRHLWHFNQKNMEQLLQKHGLTLRSIQPMKLDSYYVSLLSEKYEGKGLSRFVRAFITGLRSNIKAKKNNEYSSLIYIAQK